MYDICNSSFSDSFSISGLSSKEHYINTLLKEADEPVKDFPLRCPNCWKIPRFYANFEKNYFYTICDNQHKIEYDNFESFFENSNKEINTLLCHNCHQSIDDHSKSAYCNICNLSFCLDCKNKHEEEMNHSNYIELNKIDNFCPKHNEDYKYYDPIKKSNICQKCFDENEKNKNFIETSKYINYKETLNDYSKKIKETIMMLNNTNRLINEWLNTLTEKFNNFLNSINNYVLLQQKIVLFLNNENNYEKYKNNFNVFFNYEIINNEKIDKYIKNINNYINNNYNKNNEISSLSQFFINLLNKFIKKEINIEAKKSIVIEKEKNIDHLSSNKSNDDINKIKVENMFKFKHELKSKVKYMIPFNEALFLILGFSDGNINIYEQQKNEKDIENNLIKKLSIKEFENEINNICEIDKDLIVASDIKNNIKVIEFNDNITSYSVIKILNLEELNINNIHTITYLPIFSYYRNRHYFCIGDDNHILIFKSNKMPKNLKPPGIGYHENPEEYSIVQPSFILDDYGNNAIKEYNRNNDHNKESLTFNFEKEIKLNTLVSCIIEVSEKYIAFTCPKNNSIKIFNSQNNFKEVISFPNISPCEGNSTMCVTKDRSKLFIGCVEGFCIISLDNLKKINKIHMNQSLLSIDLYNRDCIACISLKGDDTYVKQYILKNNYKEIYKFSEKKIYSKQEVNWLKVINNKIFYLDDTNSIYYYQ